MTFTDHIKRIERIANKAIEKIDFRNFIYNSKDGYIQLNSIYYNSSYKKCITIFFDDDIKRRHIEIILKDYEKMSDDELFLFIKTEYETYYRNLYYQEKEFKIKKEIEKETEERNLLKTLKEKYE